MRREPPISYLSLQTRARDAFTLVEFLVVIAVLAGLFLPAVARAKATAVSIACVNNLRRVGLGFQVWADDHNGRLPWWVSREDGGSYRLTEAWLHFSARILLGRLACNKWLNDRPEAQLGAFLLGTKHWMKQYQVPNNRIYAGEFGGDRP